MSAPAEFDVVECPLDGINLIEASAGTGKTWNICGLYLRLLLERPLTVQQILVVTFTNAATDELRERIRSRIVETLDHLREDAPAASPADTFIPRLVAAVQRRTGSARDDLERRLDASLQLFDEAAIFTIHGFCQRALADASFSAGLPFSLELVTDEGEMTMEAIHDFWRRRIADDSCQPALAGYLRQTNDTPEKYAKLVERSLAKPLARCLWPAKLDAPAPVMDAAALTAAYDAAGRIWANRRDEAIARLQASPHALNKNSYKDTTIAHAADAWDAYFRAADPLAPLDGNAKLDLFSTSRLERGTNKNQTTPTHAFFDAADALLEARTAIDDTLKLARLRLIRELIDTVGPQLRERKRRRRVISFDDMLYNLYASLAGAMDSGPAASLREKFPAALIDEFQDTDPLQFAIFKRIYGKADAPVFFVGDPKQAIYSFRHADLHAYLRARECTSAVYTLAHNQRSTGGLIRALNGLFSANRHAFMLPGLEYHRVEKGEKESRPFTDNSLPRPDLQVWTLPTTQEGAPIAKADAVRGAARATAAEIARLVSEGQRGRITIGDRNLEPADIAVLVRTHAQGGTMKRELAALGVGSVELSQASVFETPDAEEVERVLIAISQPSRETLLRGALATEMLGFDAAAIAEISGDEAKLMGHLARFADYRDLWLRQGVGVMYRKLLTDEKVSARMLRRADGERRLTNLLHLGEQIHHAAATHESPDALLRWLGTRRRDGLADEVAQLRLESDRNLVKIVTIHKAKGLEFGIVFCPFLWDGRAHSRSNAADGREYHDRDGNAVVDFRTDEEVGKEEDDAIRSAIALENAAESLRLVYVALTRAIYRCYVVAGTYVTMSFGRPNATESARSLLNWLVAGGEESPERWLADKHPPEVIASAWDKLARHLAPHLALDPLPGDPGTPVILHGPPPESLTALPPPKAIAPAWRFASFSGLASDAKGEIAANDHDARIADFAARVGSPPPDVAPDDILRFPRGPSAGECLHAVFERIDFADPAGWNDAIARGLAEHPQFVPGGRAAGDTQLLASMVARMLVSVTSTQLPDDIVLDAIPNGRRLTELEFNLPSPHLSAHALNTALRTMGYDVPRLVFRDLEGYLKGFIDLVFEHAGRYYVLDWKSNHLGYAPSNYDPDALRREMAEHGYHLQYLLYALAVDRYLRHRVPGYRREAHFGGVLYLFVRGVRPDWVNADGTPAGVFHHRPSAATLARLDALFAGDSAKALP